MHIAEAAAAETGVVAAVGETAVAKARAGAGEAAALEPATAVKATEPPTAMEAAKTAPAAEAAATAETECAGVLGADRDAGSDRCTGQQRAGQPLSIRHLPGHPRSPNAVRCGESYAGFPTIS